MTPNRFSLLLGVFFVIMGVRASAGGPYNTVDLPPDKKVMLKGFDPVSYFKDGKEKRGSTELKSVYDGVTFWFSSKENKTAFDQEPQKYIPQYGGYCANGISYAIPWGGDPDTWEMIDGKLYIFGGQSSKNYFLMEKEKNLKLSQAYWQDEVAGSVAFLQRTKRLIFRVPGYKTGKQLEQEYASFHN